MIGGGVYLTAEIEIQNTPAHLENKLTVLPNTRPDQIEIKADILVVVSKFKSVGVS